MCGRYTLIRHNHLVEIIPNFTTPANLRLVARYNIAPTQEVPVLFPSGELQACRWGLIPHWAKDEKMAYSMINARAETLRDKPAYRKLLEKNRCLIPADGFYEWRKEKGGKVKTPMYFRMKTGAVFGFAGLFDCWHDKAAGQDVLTCTIITTGANALVAPIHDRMPAIIGATDIPRWLGADSEQALSLLKPFDPEKMETYAVSRLVNTPKQDVPECAVKAPEETVAEAASEEPAKGETGMLF